MSFDDSLTAAQGTILVAALDSILMMYIFKEQRYVTFPVSSTISSIAIHPTESCIATGDVKGQILLWYASFSFVWIFLMLARYYLDVDGDVSAKPRTSTLHWHAHGVSALAFHPDGNYLLSGEYSGSDTRSSV